MGGKKLCCVHIPGRMFQIEGGRESHRTQGSMEEEQGNGTWASVLREAGSQVFGKFDAEK